MSDIRLEQRFAIKFMHKEGETAINTYNRLRAVYGEHCISRTQSFLWFKRFRDGRMSTDNDTRSGRPATAVYDENVKEVDNLIRSDRRVRVKDIMSTLNIGANAANRIIHERLGFSKVCARWIPRHLTDDNKETRRTICQDLFEQYEKEGDGFLRRIITATQASVTSNAQF